jgi:type I restriction enzyme R subunit
VSASGLRRYRTRSITNVEVLEELLAMAKELREVDARSTALKLSPEESAFFDALAENASALEAMKDEGLAKIAKLLGEVVRTKATLDWHRKKSVQSKLRIELRRLLKKSGYPPDQCEKAAQLVIEQAERMKVNMSEGGSEAPLQVDDEEDVTEPREDRGELPFPIALVREPAQVAQVTDIPRVPGSATVLRIDAGRVDQVVMARQAADLRAALGLPAVPANP